MEELVKNIRIADYNYELPDERIARYPVSPRDSSKLLVFKRGRASETIYRQLPQQLPEGTMLLFNRTKVIQARLKFPKNETTLIEIFCLEPPEMDIQQAMSACSPVKYQCLIGGARKWKSGKLLLETSGGNKLWAEKVNRREDTFEVVFHWEGRMTFAEILDEAGETPLPPYLKRPATEKDRETYQTLYAERFGSVAAPTAGLHFTKELLAQLHQEGFKETFITLHVGAGTFKPVSSDALSKHQMHSEEFFIERELVKAIRDHWPQPLVPVGTTSLRALESIYWLGVKMLHKKLMDGEYEVQQWDAYQGWKASPKEAFDAVLRHMKEKEVEMITARTSLIIAPGYEHRICKGLLTNFHMPKSTLLLLVASLIGEDWKRVYKYALDHDFRFLSYGDGCLLLRD